MVLSDEQAKALLSSPKNLPARTEAIAWQNRVRFHGLTVRDKNASAYWPTFKKWVHSFLLAEDKRAAFDNFFPFPVPTTKLLAEVHDGWMKVFDSINPKLSIEGGDNVESDLLAYLEEIGEPDFWPDEAISALLESPNDLLLIDINESNGRPAPYLTRVPLESIKSIELTKDGVADHLAYFTTDGAIVVVDDTSYRVFTKTDSTDYEQTEIYAHNLGYCPARLLWDERIPNHAVGVSSPIDEVLSYLDAYAFWHVAFDLFKLYGAFPIYWAMESLAEPPSAGTYIPTNPDGTPDAGFDIACDPQQKGAKGSLVGPGDVFELPASTLSPVAPVGIVEPSTNALEFQGTDRQSQYDSLVQYLTGSGGESMLMSKAVNEKQATGTFTSKENVLRYLSRHLSAARQWTIYTIGKLRHGSGLVSVDQSFGTEFFLQTETELWDKLQKARTAGSPRTILLEQVQSLESFRLRSGGNPTRSQIMLDLEPMVEATIAEVQGLLSLGVIKPETLAVKLQFTDLIRQMEREFGADITQIGSALDYPTRIEKLTTYLYNNVSYKKPEPIDGPTRPTAV